MSAARVSTVASLPPAACAEDRPRPAWTRSNRRRRLRCRCSFVPPPPRAVAGWCACVWTASAAGPLYIVNAVLPVWRFRQCVHRDRLHRPSSRSLPFLSPSLSVCSFLAPEIVFLRTPTNADTSITTDVLFTVSHHLPSSRCTPTSCVANGFTQVNSRAVFRVIHRTWVPASYYR